MASCLRGRKRYLLNTRIAHIDLTAFFVSVERLINPGLAGKPIMVAGKAEQRGVVTCASYEVRPYGIRAGMSTAIAQRKCPFAIRVDSHHEAYHEYSEKVKSFLKPYAPIFEQASVDEFYIDWTGCEKLFHEPMFQFAGKIQKDILDTIGLPSAIGIASNKITAKIACDQAKPFGVKEIESGREAEFLAPLNVHVLPGVGRVMLKSLNEYDIQTCGHLAGMNSDSVGRTFGKWGLHIQESARGKGPQQLTTGREQKQISAEVTFAEDTRDKKFLFETLHGMALKLSAALRAHDLKAQCIHIKLRYADWETHTRQAAVSATYDPAVLFKKAKALLEKADTAHDPIRLIGLGVSKFGEKDLTLDLLETEKRDGLLKVVDAINSKYDRTLVKIGF